MIKPADDLPNQPPALTARHALFLDFDGTLVALADHPDRIIVPALLRETLAVLEQRLDGALAIVTGRSLESLDSFLAPLKLRAAGIHGAELRHDPSNPATDVASLGDLATRLNARFAGDPHVWIEDKRAAVAVHYRQAPERQNELFAVVTEIVNAQGSDLEIISGKCVFEARRHGHGKDAAVRALMSSPPFQGRFPVFVGDDRTDEDGIREVQAQGGFGIKVGIGASDAQWRLATPVSVLVWLRAQLIVSGLIA
ncbi:trehalose-phosphatase [uncultured Nevskia sp.]|uniref:trehalose-phosphatase n=1 Tax=uncultured Nevskia sp. TaxID=228950 RepID=UPI0025DAA648|nr:trehalose-phosphatase [uncultured Nevskia sp.]